MLRTKMRKNLQILTLLLITILCLTACKSEPAKPELSDADETANKKVVAYAKNRHTGSEVDLNFTEREIEGELNRVWKATNRDGMEYEIAIPVWCIEDEEVYSYSFEDNHDYLIAKEVLKSFPDLGALEYEFSKDLSTKTTCEESDLENLHMSFLIASQALKEKGVNTDFWTTVEVGGETLEFTPYDGNIVEFPTYY